MWSAAAAALVVAGAAAADAGHDGQGEWSEKLWFYRRPVDPRPFSAIAQVTGPDGEPLLLRLQRQCGPDAPCRIRATQVVADALVQRDIAGGRAEVGEGEDEEEFPLDEHVQQALDEDLQARQAVRRRALDPRECGLLPGDVDAERYARNRAACRFGRRTGACAVPQWRFTREAVMDVWRSWQELPPSAAAPRWRGRVLNVGAHDGLQDEPLAALLSSPEAGVRAWHVEAQERHLPGLRAALAELPGEHWPVHALLSPSEVGALLRPGAALGGLCETEGRAEDAAAPGGARPCSVDVMKLDIDSFDCELLAEVLDRVSVRGALVAEVNGVPPPFASAQLCPATMSEDLMVSDILPVHGCSLQRLVELARAHGLLLHRYSGQDALFVAADLLRAILTMDGLADNARDEDLAADEFECFRQSEVHAHADLQLGFVQEWFFNLDPLEALPLVRANVSALAAGAPWSLELPRRCGLAETGGPSQGEAR